MLAKFFVGFEQARSRPLASLRPDLAEAEGQNELTLARHQIDFTVRVSAISPFSARVYSQAIC